MKYVHGLAWGVQALLAARTLAQFNNWPAHQINTSICTWEQPRVALIRDVVYLDGGDIRWTPGLDSGANAGVASPENYQGLVLTYNLSTPFDPNSNVTGILLHQELSKAPGGIGNANGDTPNYYDGAMLANDAQFFLYGGAPFRNDEQYKLPDQTAYIEYQAYQYGSDKPAFEPGFHNLALPDGVTNEVAYGAAANAPSENKAWYFSGLASASHGPIVQDGNDNTTASIVSQTLITLDMSTQNFQKWSNKTLPASVKGRSNAELVWVPVGGQGILVVIGGVTYPDWANSSRISNNITGSQKLDPDFMSKIDVYDIENDAWYQQPASMGGKSGSIPSARARGCAVVAPAADFSSFNIFYYGGYDGLHPADPFFDEVWVLSLPEFAWIKISDGTPSHGRAGHKCVSPYPDQMMVFGGYTPAGSGGIQCLEKGPVLNFNLTSGTWMDSYDPTNFGTYGVHKSITDVIGGGASGGSPTTKPTPSGFADDKLAAVFAKPYDQKKLTKWWPYTPESSSAQPVGTKTPAPSRSGLPKWAPPVLGVVLAVIFITCAAVLFFLWRRRRLIKKSHRSSMDSRRQSMIARIMDSFSSPEKRHMSMASIISPTSPPIREEEPTPSHSSVLTDQNVARHEMPDTQLVELDANNTRSELQDTGLSMMEIDRRYAHWWRGAQTDSSSPTEVADSPSVYPPTPSIHKGLPSDGSPRIDSPPLGAMYSGSGAAMRPPPLPELDESGASHHDFGTIADTTPRGVAELSHDAEVLSSNDFVSPLSTEAGDGASTMRGLFVSPLSPEEVHEAPTKKGHRQVGSSSEVSHISSSTEDSKSPSSMRHIAFQIKDTESVDFVLKKEDRPGTSGNGEGGTL